MSLTCGRDVGPFGGQITAGKTQSLQKWQRQVKLVAARITVLRQFEGFECSIVSGSTVGSTQTILRKLEKSNPSESTGTKKHTGALGSVRVLKFSTYLAPAQDGPNRKCENLPTMEQEDREGLFFKARDAIKELPIDPVVLRQILVTLLISLQLLKEDPPEESSIAELVVIIVTVIVLAQGMEGTNIHLASNDLVRGVTQIPAKKQILFLSAFCILMHGANAQDQNKSREPEDPNAWETQYYAKAAAVTFLAVAVTFGGAGVARRMYNRWRPRQVPGANFADIDAALENSAWVTSNEEFTIWP